PEALDELILKAMARDPGDRFQSAIELLDALEAAMQAVRGPSRSDRQLERDPLDWNPPQPTVVGAPAAAPARRLLVPALLAGIVALLALVVTMAVLQRPSGGLIAATHPMQRDLRARLAQPE